MSDKPTQVVRLIRCPSCDHYRCPVYCTAGSVQYRQCGRCGHPFKTIRELPNGSTLDTETPDPETGNHGRAETRPPAK